MSVVTIGLDLAETVFQVHGADEAGTEISIAIARRAHAVELMDQPGGT